MNNPRFILLFLLLLISNCFFIKDLTKTEEKDCEVHNAPMERRLKKIRYGLIQQHPQFNLHNVRKSHFPNSRKNLCLGGCVVGKEKFVKRWECEYCTQAEKKWKKRFKESCEINNLDEVIFSGGAYAQGMQYLLDEDYLRAILSFHYTQSTFPNFHLNDKTNYWLMQIFLKLGNLHLVNEYYLNSFKFNLNNGNCGNIRDSIQIIILDSLGQHFKEVTEGNYKEAPNEKLIEKYHSQLDRIIDLITMPDTNEIQNVLSEFKVINSMIINEIKDSSLFYEELISKTCESCKELYSPL